jgi:cytochrome d ubiquinol oxidase subunit I
VPRLASLILTHELDGEIRGLNSFGDAHPPPLPLFFAFRIMVGMGLLMLATSWLGGWLLWRARWQPTGLPRAALWLFAGMTFSGWVATVAGWYVTEIGRQPFIVYGLVRTADVVSRVPSSMIGLTLALYLLLYLALIVAYVGVLKNMAEKPEALGQDEAAGHPIAQGAPA